MTFLLCHQLEILEEREVFPQQSSLSMEEHQSSTRAEALTKAKHTRQTKTAKMKRFLSFEDKRFFQDFVFEASPRRIENEMRSVPIEPDGRDLRRPIGKHKGEIGKRFRATFKILQVLFGKLYHERCL